ncbi:carbohydrate kinase [Streptomyces davaonensis JCM 4913]|uniref:Carbohydrate kinase n=1 Tax=Streptomyces davaonensis (strain DSM 101723 / JCM 4913 / KCC S-0913 / 768) TaxID=1214101 RepID=K4R3W5_STRDJ|nr:sugar kinase [Streptomyces davaonensis]CCK27785.1 carbohydrate kinase [Streptomyces davaonensis JCM 4913]
MTSTGARDVVDVVDVVALGESMVAFLPSRPGPLADVPSFDRSIGGAESNVACALAAAGHSVRWVSRVGADGFGDHLVETIGSYGVDVSSVSRDPSRPTGVYFRTAGDRGTDAHEVAYYRAGSAASAMSVENVEPGPGRVLHLSGITAALSDQCLTLLRELTAPRPDRPLISFDVNHRPALWRDAEGPRVLLELARGADIVFVGEDEAAEAWGITGGPESIRAALPEPGVLVVKQGARGAIEYRSPTPAHVTFEPALHVTPVATTGAGDAFAAGYLSATLRGLPSKQRLRHAHLWAAAALTTNADLATPPTHDITDRLAAVTDETWGTLRLGPGWTQADQRAEEEVRTP